MPPKRQLARAILSLLVISFMATLFFGGFGRPSKADAQIPTELITSVLPTSGIIVSDVGAKLQAARKSILDRITSKLKVATDIAFQNASRQFLAHVVQEFAVQIATTGPGQKPLFLTNPQTFFRDVANSAAGDFIDGYQRGLTGGSINPQGLVSGRQLIATNRQDLISQAQQRFIVSRILRAAVGSPLQQCQDSCRVNYGITNTQSTSVTGLAQLNDHERNITFVNIDIQKTQETAAKTPDKDYACPDVVSLPCSSSYCPFSIVLSTTPWPGLTANQCLAAQREAVRTERSESQTQVNSCLTECRVGVAGPATQAINSFTATDVFGAVQKTDVTQAPADIANALSRDKSGIGQLLGAAGALTATVQERVLGEDTNLKSGVLPKVSPVSKKIQTPAQATSALFGVPFYNSAGQLTYTGTGAADILKGIASFLNSPIGKALTTYFKSKCGLNPDSCRGPSNPSSALGQLLFGSGGPTGTAGAQLQFATLGQPQLITGDPGRNEITVTDQLASSGLIDAQFRSAIEEQLTVQEALDQKKLDAKKTFGFDKNGVEPREGYPFRTLQYLRRFRVVPVGWELAAKYSQSFGHRDLSLGHLTKAYAMCGQDANHSVCLGGANPDQACQQDSECGLDGAGKPGRCAASPYCGLVDPNWVLKAPQTYCRRQGAGEEIISREFICDQNNIDKDSGAPIPPGTKCSSDPTDTNAPCHDLEAPNCNQAVGNTHPDIGHWIVDRNPDTCADVQSCIAENEDGTCQAYGYCVQERQTYKFNGTQCAEQNASCTSYTDVNGQQVSYLAATLDFRNCSSSNAGCQWFCQQPSFDATKNAWTCTDTTGSKIDFNGQVASCAQSQAGCHQYIRTVNGTNLLPNSGFEQFTGGPVDSGNAATFAVSGTGWGTDATGISLKPVTADDPAIASGNSTAVDLSGASTDSFSQTINTGYSLNERVFTASIRAKSAGTCQAKLSIAATKSDTSPFASTGTIDITSSWQTYAISLFLPTASQVTFANTSLTYRLILNSCGGAGLVIDSAQLQEGAGLTAYKDYGLINTIYLSGARQQCTSEDVGCELYTPETGGPKVTAVAHDSNRCSADSVGCATYHREPIATVPQRDYPAGLDTNIVAPRGQLCSAADVGCEEYTNLDQAAQGGEAKAYFKAVKQCVKPTNTKVTTATFYTWIGDPQKGFILRAYDLVKSNIGNGPCTKLSVGTTAADPQCADTGVVNPTCQGPADLDTNPACAEYYDSGLNVYYRLRQSTVSVTNDCHPFRNTIDSENGNDLVYYLSPQENLSCNKSAAFCRAYTGNAGKTTRQIFKDTFEPGTTANWTGGTPSSASVNLNGHSMKISTVVFSNSTLTQGQFSKGKSYLVTFTAAAATNVRPTVTASLGTANGPVFNEIPSLVFPGSAVAQWNDNITPKGAEWNAFTLGPLVFNQDPLTDLRLALKTSGDVYVDNVTLIEINDSLYLISKTVPLCQQSEVGCAAYRDRSRQLQYFTSFARICSEQVVGCEALVDTQNSSTPFAQTVKNIDTPADQVVTYVNNPAAYCPAAAKGCAALGQPIYIQDHTLSGFRTVYLKNDPDQYSATLCTDGSNGTANELMCQAYTQSDGSAAFFKDPTTQTCEFRTDTSQAGGTWYIAGTQYVCPTVTPPQSGRPTGAACTRTCTAAPGAGRAGKACVSNVDCPGSACSGDATKVGKITGGINGQCTTDADCLGGNKCTYLAGTCPDAENGCTEYRDPTDPVSCRAQCPLQLQGASPVFVDASCTPTICQGSTNPKINGQNCQSDNQCGGGTCVGGNGASATGLPGCRAYFYIRQSLEDKAAECDGQINLATGCRPFNDTSNPALNFRGQ